MLVKAAYTIAKAVMDDIERRQLCHERITLAGLETIIQRAIDEHKEAVKLANPPKDMTATEVKQRIENFARRNPGMRITPDLEQRAVKRLMSVVHPVHRGEYTIKIERRDYRNDILVTATPTADSGLSTLCKAFDLVELWTEGKGP